MERSSGATMRAHHATAEHARDQLAGVATTAGRRSRDGLSPRANAVQVMGFGQQRAKSKWSFGGKSDRGGLGRNGERTRRRGSGRARGDERERSRLRWACALAFVWAFGPFARKCVEGFNKVYMRRWFYPIERPVPCQPTAGAPKSLLDNEPIPELLPADLTNLPGLRPKTFKVGIISLCDSGVEAICAQSTANKQAYADLHGYDLIVDEDIVDRNRPTSWSKLLAMRKYLPEYDFLFYVDIDTIIMNPEQKLEDIVDYDYDQILAADKNGVNCGVWMVRNTPWMLWFIDELWAQDQLVAPKSWNMLFKYEQRAFHFLYQSKIWRQVVKGEPYPKANTVRARTKVLNACVFNSQPAFFVDGDLLVHLAGLKGTVKCMWFRYYYKISLAKMRKLQVISPDADIPPPTVWTCLTRRT